MATELGLLSLTQLQKLAHQSQQQQLQPNPSSTVGSGLWMWNTSRRPVEEDDSWEVRAFAEDTGNIMGTTWPPRSYTCTFCRREFRSAQALGGHMNVHRRDRARLRLSPPVSADPSTSASTSSSNLIFPSQELIAANGGGICFLYPLAGSPSTIYTSTSMNRCMESPSTLLSITPYPTNNLNSSFPPVTNLSAGMTSIHPSSLFHYSSSSNHKASVSIDNEKLNDDIHNTNNCNRIEEVEELDLELRLGTGPSSS